MRAKRVKAALSFTEAAENCPKSKLLSIYSPYQLRNKHNVHSVFPDDEMNKLLKESLIRVSVESHYDIIMIIFKYSTSLLEILQ